jgi:hypothetical protein
MTTSSACDGYASGLMPTDAPAWAALLEDVRLAGT